MKHKANIVWLSYDLGFSGDYTGLYSWLDKHDAKECGDNLAVIKDYEYTNDIFVDIALELKKHVSLKNTDRIYLIAKVNGELKGKFIFGKRKKAPWVGYSDYLTSSNEDK